MIANYLSFMLPSLRQYPGLAVPCSWEGVRIFRLSSCPLLQNVHHVLMNQKKRFKLFKAHTVTQRTRCLGNFMCQRHMQFDFVVSRTFAVGPVLLLEGFRHFSGSVIGLLSDQQPQDVCPLRNCCVVQPFVTDTIMNDGGSQRPRAGIIPR